MRWSRSLPVLVVLMLLLAAPAYGAGSLKMNCPRCDHVDVEGHGLQANATLILVIRDVRSGQEVVSETRVTTASVYNQAGTDVELAAHTRASAPPHCTRAASLPYSGSPSAGTAALAGGLLGAGGLLLLLTRRRPRPAGP